MNAKVILPVPARHWSTFKESVERFVQTYRDFPSGYEHRLILIVNGPVGMLNNTFKDLDCWVLQYEANTSNLGSAQAALSICFDTDFIVCLSPHCYFHRADWLKRMMEVRFEHGSGMYGTGSFEKRKHIRLVAFGIDARLLRMFPHQITNPYEAYRAEADDWCLTDFVIETGGVAIQPTWDSSQMRDDWRKPSNIFRRGDQSNVLVWDKCTEEYAQADAVTKLRREALTDGRTDD